MGANGETKIIYYIDEGHEDTPYLIKLPIGPDTVTLADFKNALKYPNFKFYFKSMDADFGVVKEELTDDDAILPNVNGRVVSWLVRNEELIDSTPDTSVPTEERLGGIGDSRPPSFHAQKSYPMDQDASSTSSSHRPIYPKQKPFRQAARRHRFMDGGSSMMTSDLESTSFFDSEDDRLTMSTETTSRSSKYGRRKRRRKHRMPAMSRGSSISSVTDSTMSLNVITVTLPMDTVQFLGISVVGQSNKNGEGGIYIGSIMKGGAVAQDGRIEPGDMVLEVNGVSFENMTNDDAVKTLREAVHKPGPIRLVIAKCWESSPKGYFTIPRQEPVRPIDPSAWVAHTAAMRADWPGRPGLSPPSISGSSSLASSIPETERFEDNMPMSVNTDMAVVVRSMRSPESGLEIRDRMWLKITIPNAFIGSDLVDWLFNHLEGFSDRRDAVIYARGLLKAGYIRHTVNKITFSQQCYYVFGDSSIDSKFYDFSSLTLDEDPDSVSQVDRDTLAPLPAPTWNNQMAPFASSSNYIRQTTSYNSMPFAYSNEAASYSTFHPPPPTNSGSESSGSETPAGEEQRTHITDLIKEEGPNLTRMPPPPPPPRPLASVPPGLTDSKQSFRMAMGNPCEMFVDIM